MLTKEILEQIGFKESSFDFGNFKLTAQQMFVPPFREVIYCSGINKTERSIELIEIKLPLEVESFELGVALLSYSLGRDFKAEIIPDWYYDGIRWENLLPWKKQMEEYNQNPKANIEHDYFKLIVQKMRQIAETALESDCAVFSYDGEILKIICSNEIIIAPASGSAWKEKAFVKTKSLDFLPKRIEKRNVNIYIWENMLHIANRAFHLFRDENLNELEMKS